MKMSIIHTEKTIISNFKVNSAYLYINLFFSFFEIVQENWNAS